MTPTLYTVQPGFQFRRPDGSLAGPGDTLELADEVVAANPAAAVLFEPPQVENAHPAD